MTPLTKTERRSLLLVVFVLALSAIIQWLRPHTIQTAQFDYTLQDSLFKALSADTQNISLTKQAVQSTKRIRKRTSRKSKKKEVLRPKSIRINSASVKELERLPYIGPKTADAIVRYRQEHGPFKTIEELDNVKRIGPKTIERIRPYLILDGKADTTR